MSKQRKVMLYFVSIIFISIALLLNKVNGTEWVAAVGGLYGLFIAGNAVEHITKTKKKK